MWFSLCSACSGKLVAGLAGTKQRLSPGAEARCDVCGAEALLIFYPADPKVASSLEQHLSVALHGRRR
jgi:hypothetical protein